MIKCPKCGTVNNIQHYCGDCGNRLLADGVEIERRDLPQPAEKNTSGKARKWIIGVIVFLVIWIIGGAVMTIIAGALRWEERYVPAICFLIGILAMIAIGTNTTDNEDET